MNQIVNILRKDARHLRLEILASLTVLLLFNLAEPKAWLELYGPAANASQITVFLVFVSWAILILRLVHLERLAGLNQFWTTRPYEWPNLLAAKTIFVLLFVYIPFLATQCYLLHHGGFAIAPNLSLMFHNLLNLTTVFILPVACIAVVTTSFAQAIFSFLGIAVAAACLNFTFTYLGSVSATFGMARRSPLFLMPLELGIASVLLSLTLLLQYRRRVTFKSIAILGTAAVLLILIPQVVEGTTAAANGYTAAPDAPASVSVDTSTEQTFSMKLPKNRRTAVYEIPLMFSNFTPGAVISREAERYTFTGANGYTWTSGWLDEAGYNNSIEPQGTDTFAHSRSFIVIPWPVQARLVGAPIAVRIEFLVSQLENERPYTYSLTPDDQVVPDVGVCGLDEAEERFSCRAAFGQSHFVGIRTFGSLAPCDASADTPQAAAPVQPTPESGFFIGRMRAIQSPMPVISPVMVNMVNLSAPKREETGHLCPGTPITFVAKSFQRRIYLETPPATITLKDSPGHFTH